MGRYNGTVSKNSTRYMFTIGVYALSGSENQDYTNKKVKVRIDMWIGRNNDSTYTFNVSDKQTWVYSNGDPAASDVNMNVSMYSFPVFFDSGNGWGDIGHAILRTQDVWVAVDPYTGNFTLDLWAGAYLGSSTWCPGTVQIGTSETYKSITEASGMNFITKCGKPATLTALTGKTNELFEGSVTLYWSAGSNGDYNTVNGYEIQQRIFSKGAWGAWAYSNANANPDLTKDSRSAVDSAIDTDGDFQQFAIRAKGSAGAAYYSDWTYSNAVKNNTPPLAPNVVTLNVSDYSQGEQITLSWSGASDVDSNIVKYQIDYAISLDGVTYGAFSFLKYVSSTTGSGNVNIIPTEVLTNGGYIKYQITAIDALGQASSSMSSLAIQRKDDNCLFVGVNGQWVKMGLYLGVNGQWKKQKIYAGVSGAWKETKS